MRVARVEDITLKKPLITAVSLLCIVVMLTVSFVSAGTFGSVGSFVADQQQVASSLSGTGETITDDEIGTDGEKRDFPTKDEQPPEDCEIWKGDVASDFAGGTGTTLDPYQIATPAQFAYLMFVCDDRTPDPNSEEQMLYRDRNFIITNDLVFNRSFTKADVADETQTEIKPLINCGATVPFNGTIDGQGHRLYNIYVRKQDKGGMGLFGEFNGVMQNFHVVGGYMNGRASNLTDLSGGTLIRRLIGTMRNCSSSMDYDFVAGICGGLVGYVENKSLMRESTVINCRYSGNLNVKGEGTGRALSGVGGIIGAYKQPKEKATITFINDCINSGTITSNGKFVGGIVGIIDSGNGDIGPGFYFGGCVNFGDIVSTYHVNENATDKSGRFGGILGSAVGQMGDGGARIFENCANFGKIISEEGLIGGIVGSVEFKSNLSTTRALEFNRCYQYGYVGAPDEKTDIAQTVCVGGLVGQAACPISANGCHVDSKVVGYSSVGGAVGRALNSSRNSGVKLVTTRLNVDVKGHDGVGGVIGRYLSGSINAMSEVALMSTYVSGRVNSVMSAGGLIGETLKGGDKTTIYNLKYSIMDVRVEIIAGEDGKVNKASGILIGSMQDDTGDGATFDDRDVNFFFAAEKVYEIIGADERVPATVNCMRGTTYSLVNVFDEKNLTDGVYLGNLQTGDNLVKGFGNWIAATEDRHPIHETVDQLLSVDASREYNEKRVEFTHPAWMGQTPYYRWFKKVGDEWVEIGSAPSDVGEYRVYAALLSSAASGAGIVEFKILQRSVDLSTLQWTGEIHNTYTGETHVIKLGNVPLGLDISYEGNSGKDAGSYTARVVAVSDPTGNYNLLNEDRIPEQIWRIDPVIIIFDNLEWSGMDASAKHPVLYYTGEEQSVYLYDVSQPELDLTKVLTITYYTNEELHQTSVAKDVGTYSALARIENTDIKNVTVIGLETYKEIQWEVRRRVIKPMKLLELSDVLAGEYTDAAVSEHDPYTIVLTYDASSHALGFNEEAFPSDSVQITLTPEIEGDGKFKDAGEHKYKLEIVLTDSVNNVFAFETIPNTGIFEETSQTTITQICTLHIKQISPDIKGAEIRGPIAATSTSAGSTGPIYNGSPYYIGVKYKDNGAEIDYKIILDKDGNPVTDPETGEVQKELQNAMYVSIDQMKQALAAELDASSIAENFEVVYYRQVQVAVYGPDGTQMRDEKGKLVYQWVDIGGNAMVTDENGVPTAPVNAGRYRVTIKFNSDNPNFTNAQTESVLVISRANYEIPSNIRFPEGDSAVQYANGLQKDFRLLYEEELPYFIIPVYSYNTVLPPIEAGRYEFMVRFTLSPDMAENYNEPKPQKGTLIIKTDVLWSDQRKNDNTLSVHFGEEGTTYTLLAAERQDTASFVTDWKLGYNTRLSCLWKIEIYDGTEKKSMFDDTVTIRIPLKEHLRANANRDNTKVVSVNIKEDGSYDFTELKYFFGDVPEGEQFPTYVEVDARNTGYYGIVTVIDEAEDFPWRLTAVIASCAVAVIAVAIIVAGVVVRMKKKKAK